jgi:hypothetical protein
MLGSVTGRAFTTLGPYVTPGFGGPTCETANMRWMVGGPDLPPELLQALEDGHLVFFCGAGVRMERACLRSVV